MRDQVPVVVLSLLSLVSTQSRSSAPAAGTSEDVKALVSRQYTALAEGNAGALRDLYATGGQLVFYPLAASKVAGAALHLQALDEFRKTNAIHWPPPNDVNVVPLGAAGAVSTASFHVEGAGASGQPVVIDGRHTAVWQRSSGQWRIVHEHFSAPWTAPAPPKPQTGPPATGAPQIVAGVLNAYQQAWSSDDATALASLWDDDGDIGTLGAAVSTRGRAAVAEFWQQSISRRRTPTVVQAAATSARGITSDVIAADGAFEYRLKGASAALPAVSTDRFALTLRHVSSAWKIATLRIAGGK